MKRLTIRLLVGLAFALPMMLLAAAMAQAKPLPSPLQQVTADNCLACHSKVNDSWMVGAHGKAATDEKFLAAWKEKGNDPSCTACQARAMIKSHRPGRPRA
jgi:hypothetical protein